MRIFEKVANIFKNEEQVAHYQEAYCQCANKELDSFAFTLQDLHLELLLNVFAAHDHLYNKRPPLKVGGMSARFNLWMAKCRHLSYF